MSVQNTIVKQEHDANNRVSYAEFSDGTWERYEYDELGSMTYKEFSWGHWERWEYLSPGKWLSYIISNGLRYTKTYNDKQMEIKFEDSDGNYTEYEYDAAGRLTQTISNHKENDGQHISIRDKHGRLLKETYPDGRWQRYEYADDGREVYREYNNGHWRKTEYMALDNNGESIRFHQDNGYTELNIRNAAGVLEKTMKVNSKGFKERWEYNNRGLETHYTNSDGEFREWEYDNEGILTHITERKKISISL